jgi:hypothetical protein
MAHFLQLELQFHVLLHQLAQGGLLLRRKLPLFPAAGLGFAVACQGKTLSRLARLSLRLHLLGFPTSFFFSAASERFGAISRTTTFTTFHLLYLLAIKKSGFF